MTLLIDGHNLIGRIPDLHLDDPEDEEKLLVRLRSYRARTGKRLVVYFDPGVTYQLPASKSQGGIAVRRAGSGQRADDLIVRDLRRHPNPRELAIVTSDRIVQNLARQYGAHVITSASFAAELSRPPEAKAVSEMPSLSEDEIQEWLAIFGQSDD